jgi:hypothetical protein
MSRTPIASVTRAATIFRRIALHRQRGWKMIQAIVMIAAVREAGVAEPTIPAKRCPILGGGLRRMRTAASIQPFSAHNSIGPPPTRPDTCSVEPRSEAKSHCSHRAQVISAANDTQVISIVRMPRDTD